MPGATVPVEDIMPEGPGLGTVAMVAGGALLLLMLTKGKK
jgi:hypothetical protein